MRRLLTTVAATTLGVLLLASPVLGSEEDVAYIEEVTHVAAASYLENDFATFEDAKAELYAAYLDPATPEGCRQWIDAVVIAIEIAELQAIYPESEAQPILFGFMVEALPIFRNDCLLAI